MFWGKKTDSAFILPTTKVACGTRLQLLNSLLPLALKKGYMQVYYNAVGTNSAMIPMVYFLSDINISLSEVR